MVSILASNYRHLRFPQSKIVCLLLMARIGIKCSDDVITQRILPLTLCGLEVVHPTHLLPPLFCLTIFLFLQDPAAPVRTCAVRSIRSLVEVLREGFSAGTIAADPQRRFDAAEVNLFPLYVFPALSRLMRDPDISVRVALAGSVGKIAEAAKRFLDQSHYMSLRGVVLSSSSSSFGSAAAQTQSSSPQQEAPVNTESAVEFSYDSKLEALKEQVSKWIRDLLQDSSAGSSYMTSSYMSGSTALPLSSASSGAGSTNHASMIRQVILGDILLLCRFFGQESIMEKLLTQLLTFLNESVSKHGRDFTVLTHSLSTLSVTPCFSPRHPSLSSSIPSSLSLSLPMCC